jgi:serine/threonine protein kinase
MSTLADIQPGQALGRYELLAPIAQGGMASVWAARQWGSRGFSKIVAIKTMLPTISDDPRFERMFLDEARIASKIRHNHVVEILDLGEQDSMLYLVMELVDGESLSTIRRAAAEHGGIPLSVSIRIIADVCAGLHAAHELHDDEGESFGLVHRDVSPQNVLVGYDGVTKVLDFGVAKVAGRTADTTGIGHARGKPPYMAPEQALGHSLDRRADIFSLGIVLYQLVAERHPFRGENDIATLHNIISDRPIVSPRSYVPDLPEGVERIILQALERDPALRFQSARDMELALERCIEQHVGRIRSEEIGHFVSSCLGARGADRRNALREAIRRADLAEVTLVDYASAPAASRPGVVGTPSESGSRWAPPAERSSPRGSRGNVERVSSSDAAGTPRSARGWRERPVIDGDPDATRLDFDLALEPHGPLPEGSRPQLAGADSTRAAGGWVPHVRRAILFAFLAAAFGATFAWVSQSVKGGRFTTGHAAASGHVPPAFAASDLPSSVRVEPPASASVVERATPPNPPGPSDVPVEPKPSRDTKPRTTQQRSDSPVPSYTLPPISSPGF